MGKFFRKDAETAERMKDVNMRYYATVKHYSITGYWDQLQATNLHAAKREATRRYGGGYHGHVIHLIEVTPRMEGENLNDIPAWTREIPSGKWEQPIY